jgi:hypothetical protein
MRKGRDIPITEHPTVLTVNTRCPEKWVLVDTETGQTYKGNAGGYWDRLDPIKREEKTDEV